jgi:LysM repeat protein
MKIIVSLFLICAVQPALFAQRSRPAEIPSLEELARTSPAAAPAGPLGQAGKQAAAARPEAAAGAKPEAAEIVPARPKPKPARAGLRAEKVHVVRRGDTLWDLSRKYYGDPFLWGRIYNANTGDISNPDLIRPLQEFVIPGIEDHAVPVRAAAAERAAPAAPAPAPAVLAPAAPTGPAAPMAAAQSRPATAAFQSPAAVPQPAAERIVQDSLSEEMPHDQREFSGGVLVVPDSWREDGVITARLKNDDPFLADSMAETGSMMRISIEKAGIVKPGDILKVYMRAGDVYSKDGKKLGRGLQQAGELEVIGVDGTTASARVTYALSAIRAGYLVKKK